MTSSIYGGLVEVDFFPVTTNSNIADFSLLVTFFLNSTPAFFSKYCCKGYQDDLEVRHSSFRCVRDIFSVGPTAIPLSSPSFLRTHVGAHSNNVRVSLESGVQLLPQIGP